MRIHLVLLESISRVREQLMNSLSEGKRTLMRTRLGDFVISIRNVKHTNDAFAEASETWQATYYIHSAHIF